jgi:hypothetical protein
MSILKNAARRILRQEMADMKAAITKVGIECYAVGVKDGFEQGKIYGKAEKGSIVGVNRQLEEIFRKKGCEYNP